MSGSTLDRIRAKAQQARETRQEKRSGGQQAIIQRHEAAQPLFQAFQDVKDQYVRIDVLKRIWPDDYHARDDRVAGLVIAYLGAPDHPCGLKLHLPGGQRSFYVQQADDGSLRYVTVYESTTGHPHELVFTQTEPWLEVFYKAMALVLEL